MVQQSLFEADSLARVAELEARYGHELDRLMPAEIHALAYSAFRGHDFPVLLCRRYGRHSKLVRPVLLRALAADRA